MDNKKDDKYRINRILKDINFVINALDNITIFEFEKNEILCDSICFRFIQMSENAGKLSKEFIEMHHDVPFHLLKGIRNRIVHDYGNVDMSIVYYTVKNDLYEFRKKLMFLLEKINV